MKCNFKYHLYSPEDLPNYTDLAISTVLQRQSIPFRGEQALLAAAMHKSFCHFKSAASMIRLIDAINLIFESGFVVLEVNRPAGLIGSAEISGINSSHTC